MPDTTDLLGDDAIHALQDDRLWLDLIAGNAGEADQRYAARWILWLMQFAPVDRVEAMIDGREDPPLLPTDLS